jgi:hypothetical protein
MSVQTINGHRRKDNPLEAGICIVIEAWIKQNTVCFDQAIHGSDHTGQPLSYLSLNEKLIAFTTLQWLGSPVGQSFLRECGFVPTQDTAETIISTPTASEILSREAENMIIMGKSTPIKHTQGIKYGNETYSRTEFTDGTFAWKSISYDGDVNENRLEAIYQAKKC